MNISKKDRKAETDKVIQAMGEVFDKSKRPDLTTGEWLTKKYSHDDNAADGDGLKRIASTCYFLNAIGVKFNKVDWYAVGEWLVNKSTMENEDYKDDGWIDVDIPWSEFEDQGLNKPGTLILMSDGKEYMIGHINTIRGVCDDCTKFNSRQVIHQYKVVWNES